MKPGLAQLRAALDRADPAVRLYLLHGPDEAGAHDHAARLARAMGAEAERVDLESAALRADPALLPSEAAALSLFGGARFIRVRGAGEECLRAVELLLAAPRAGNPVVMIAPTIKSSGKLVKLATAAPGAMSFACYPPEGAEGARLAANLAAEHGLKAGPAVAQRLAAATGGDRAVMTREIEKFALYLNAAPERPMPLDEATLDALGADLAEAELSDAVGAVIDRDAARLGHALAALDEQGLATIPLLRALVRRLITLAAMRADVDKGQRAEAVVEAHRVHFREKGAMVRALRIWDARAIAGAIARLHAAERAQMAGGPVVEIAVAAACIEIARAAR